MVNDLRKFRPLTDSLDLVRAPFMSVWDAVQKEVRRYTNGEKLTLESSRVSSAAELFESVQTFANLPLTYFILPTRSDWTVLWFDSFLCDGYDSLCWNLTQSHGFETLHQRSTDVDSRMLRGNSFTHRHRVNGRMEERSVYCAVADAGRWRFEAHGTPLPEEDLSSYNANRNSARLNENLMEALLGRLQAFPWACLLYTSPSPRDS